MLPSIKESDRLTCSDRIKYAAFCFFPAFAMALLYGVYDEQRLIGFALLVQLVISLILLAISVCVTYKNRIKLVPAKGITPVCPSCLEEGDSVEWYNERTRDSRHSMWLTRWVDKTHCRWCGYKGDRRTSSRHTSDLHKDPLANLPDDPIAKAEAILDFYKTKQPSVTSQACYEQVHSNDMPLYPKADETGDFELSGKFLV
ncbi:hypothetical protein ACA910_001131 [Epithemia clementina (nom. ined.)]